MDRDELIRNLGEQTLLQEERSELASTFERDRRALVALANSVDSAARPEWLESSTTLISRLHTSKTQLARLDAEISDLRKLTGR